MFGEVKKINLSKLNKKLSKATQQGAAVQQAQGAAAQPQNKPRDLRSLAQKQSPLGNALGNALGNKPRNELLANKPGNELQQPQNFQNLRNILQPENKPKDLVSLAQEQSLLGNKPPNGLADKLQQEQGMPQAVQGMPQQAQGAAAQQAQEIPQQAQGMQQQAQGMQQQAQGMQQQEASTQEQAPTQPDESVRTSKGVDNSLIDQQIAALQKQITDLQAKKTNGGF